MTRLSTKWIHVCVLAIGLFVAPQIGALFIRLFHQQWATPILMTLWFAYGIWFLLKYGFYRSE